MATGSRRKNDSTAHAAFKDVMTNACSKNVVPFSSLTGINISIITMLGVLRLASIFTGRGAAKLGTAGTTSLCRTGSVTVIPPDSGQKDIIVLQLLAHEVLRAGEIEKMINKETWYGNVDGH